MEVCHKEVFNIEPKNAAEMCGNDVRQVLPVLQILVLQSSHNRITYRVVKERESRVNKDEILR